MYVLCGVVWCGVACTVNYPGGALFDPLKFTEDPVASEKLKVSEIKHGRLAMLAMLAYAIEAVVSGDGPVGAARKFISNL